MLWVKICIGAVVGFVGAVLALFSGIAYFNMLMDNFEDHDYLDR